MKKAARFAICILSFLIVSCGQQRQEQHSALQQLPETLRKVLEETSRDPAYADADIALAIRGSKVAEIINSINTIPEGNRQVSIQVLSEQRKLKDEPDYYLELYDLPQNKATGSIRQVSANWTPEGALGVDAVLAVSGTTRIHGHYKPANTGGHIGLNLGATTTLRGKLIFEPDANEFFAVTFKLDPTSLSYSASSSITDHNEFCWRIEYPCAGTWREPIRTCEGKDCKTLWSYNIPIGISDTIQIPRTMMKLPVRIGLPEEFKVETMVGDVEFNRSVGVTLKPIGFTSDKHGLFVKAAVTIEQKTPDQARKAAKS